VINASGGVVNNTNHTITWSDVNITDGSPWNKSITLKASQENASCACRGTVTNVLSINDSIDCCGCTIGGTASQNIIVSCINMTVLLDSRKTASPSSQENCRNITYTNYYNFSELAGGLINWNNANFTELGGNNQTFPGGSNTGNATFIVNGTCTVDQTITIGTPIDLGFLVTECGSLNNSSTLEIVYTLYQPNAGSITDWSRLCVNGYGSGCDIDSCLYDFVSVSVCSASVSVNIAGITSLMDNCGLYDLTLNIDKGCGNSTNVNLTYDDSVFMYVNGTTNITGIVNESGSVQSFEPVRNGSELFWRLADQISEGGVVSFKVEKSCGGSGPASATVTWVDNCGNARSGSSSAVPSLILSGDIIIEKNPEVILALDKTPTWKIYVTNTGSGTAHNAKLKDYLDLDLTYNSSTVFDVDADTGVETPRGSFNVTVTGQEIIWDLGDLAPKQKCMVELVADLVGCENLDNVAYAVWGCGDPFDPCQNESDFSTVEIVDGQLVVGRHDAEPVDDCGEPSHFVIEVRNGADPTVYNISVIEQLPAGLQYILGSSNVTGKTPSFTNFGNLSAPEWMFDQPEGWEEGTVVTIEFDVNVTDNPCEFTGGSSTARLNYTTPCGAYGLELESEVLIERTDPHVSVTKSPELTISEKDLIVNWTIELESDGVDRAGNVTLFDVLPLNTEFYSADPAASGNGSSSDPLRWNLGYMNVGNKTYVNISAKVTFCADETENNATVYWGCCPPYQGSSSDVAFLRTPPEIDLSKVHGDIDTCGGNFTITIENTGSTAYTPLVDEILPVGFVYKPNSAVINSSNGSHAMTDEPQYFPNGTTIWNASNIDRVYRNETITIEFEMESCPTCCNVSVVPNSNLVYFNYTNKCGDPLSKNFSQSITPKLAVLNIEKTPLNQTIGEIATWTISVTNTGNQTAYNVNVTDILGNGFVNVNVTEADGTKTLNQPLAGYTTINWTSLSIPVGTPWVRHLSASGIASGSLVNNAFVVGTCANGCIYSQDEDVAYTSRVVTTQVPKIGRRILVLDVQGNLATDSYQNKKRYQMTTN